MIKTNRRHSITPMVCTKMPITCITAFVIVCLSLVSAEVCPNGWVRHDTSCYSFEGIPAEPWYNASVKCREMDAELATVESSREDNFLRNALLHLHGKDPVFYWLGGTDSDTEGHWVWSDTDTLITGYTNWAPGQPDDYNAVEDCLRLTGAGLGFKWDDGNCENPGYYICERVDSEVAGNMIIG